MSGKAAYGVKYLASPLLERHGVAHAFMTRVGGVSPPPCAGLNFDSRTCDTQENVRANTRIAADAFGMGPDALVTLNQVHGSGVAVIGDGDLARAKERRPEADGAVTALRGVALAILTADCLPVLIYDPVRRAAGAAHAGWRGVVKGAVVNTVEAMARVFGSPPADLVAALGPCIGPCCYSVGADVRGEFERAFRGRADGYFSMRGAAAYLDLGAAARGQLTALGVTEGNITTVTECTSCNAPGRFYSYRKEGASTGRQLSFIMAVR